MKILGELWQNLNNSYWDLCEKIEKTTGIPIFSKFVTPIELKGVPSILVLFAIFGMALIGIGLIASTSSFSLNSGTSFFSIKLVNEEGQPLNGISVTLTAIDAVDAGLSQTSITVNGVAEFNLPADKKYSLRVDSSTDFEPSVAFVFLQNGRQQTVKMLSAKRPISVAFLFVQNSVGAPVTTSQVEYSDGEALKTTRVNSSGYAALIVKPNVSISVNVSAAKYGSASLSFLPVANRVKTITLLEIIKGKSANLNALAQQRQHIFSPTDPEVVNSKNSSIRVNVNTLTDHGLFPVPNALVVIYNSFSKTSLGQLKTNSAGAAVFSTPSFNPVKLYAAVEAEGFVTTLTPEYALNDSLEFNVTLQIPTSQNSFDFFVKLLDDSGSTQVSSDVYILSSQNAIITKKTINGQGNFSDLPAGSFYIAATDNKHLRFVSSLLPSNTTQFTLNLKTALTNNSATIGLSAVDFQDKPVPYASLSLFLTNVFSPVSITSDYNGNASFGNVPIGTPVLIRSEKNTFLGQLAFTPYNSSTNKIILKPPSGTVAFSVVDYATSNPLTSAKLQLFYKASPTELVELPSTNCSFTVNSPSCTLSLVSGISYVASASLDNYYSTSIEFQAEPLQHIPVQLKLFPTSFQEQLAFSGIFEPDTGRKLDASESLAIGKQYAAKFMLRTNKGTTANQYGLYARIGNVGESITSDNAPAGLLFSSPDNALPGSIFYSPIVNASQSASTGQCDSNVEQNGFGVYKWIYGGGSIASTQSDFVETTIPIMALSPGATSLQYFSLTIFQADNTADSAKTIRFPYDLTLKESFSSSDKKWCDGRTESIPLKVEQKEQAKCNAYACIKASLQQGETISFSSLAARPTQETGKNLEINYEVLNFQQTPSVLSFSPPADVLQLDPGHTTEIGSINTGENKFETTSDKFKIHGTISSAVQNKKASEKLKLVYGNKISLELPIEVTAPPEPLVQLAGLPNFYTISFETNTNSFSLKEQSTSSQQTRNSIQMYTDPIFPADAVLLRLNYSSSQCEGGENDFLLQLTQDSTCFEITDAPDDFATGDSKRGLKLLKYDASGSGCSAYSVDLNTVNEANAKLNVKLTCGTSINEFPIHVSLHPGVASQMDTDFYRGLQTQRIFSEPDDDLGDTGNLLSETPHQLWAMLVNRQHTRDSSVFIGGNTGYLNDNSGSSIVLQQPRSTNAKSTLSGGKDLSQELNSPSPPYSPRLFTEDLFDKEIESQQLANALHEARIIAANTVFRRAPLGCDSDANCKFKTFPFSAFEPNKDFSYQLGAAYLGVNREHKANLESVEFATKDSDGKSQQGVYSISINYEKTAQGYQWKTKATPLSISSIDYYDEQCAAPEQPLQGNALTWRQSCLATCGDGTYYGLTEGDAGALCDGNTFTVNTFHKTVEGTKILKLVAELGSCYVAGCAATSACTVIAQHTCEAAIATAATACSPPAVTTPAGPAACTAAGIAKETACSPKELGCALTAGATAIGATYGIQSALADGPTGCDLVAESTLAVAGAAVNEFILGGYFLPFQQVCYETPFAAPIVAPDAAPGASVIAAACNTLVGTRFLGLIGSWIANAATEEKALPNRAYVAINGKTCTPWQNNLGSYFVYQDCNFGDLWARENKVETCKDANNVKIYTKSLDTSEKLITFKVKS